MSAHVIVAFHTATTLNTERCASGPWDERLVDGLRTPSHWTRERRVDGVLNGCVRVICGTSDHGYSCSQDWVTMCSHVQFVVLDGFAAHS